MIQLFKAWRVDLIILAGYMRVLKKPSEFPAPIINVHPSLLPKYKGLNVVERAMEAGEEVTGCTVHYVNEELDGGEIIKQGVVPILPDDTVESLTKAIQRMEYGILPAAIEEIKTLSLSQHILA
jgi:formyltetrahydrofolate-dependent phosphoribosylglycinamide formyltransferase